MNQSNFRKDLYERKIKLISTFRINMEYIHKWNEEVAFFHQNLYEDCQLLQSKIDEILQSLLSIFDQKCQLEIVSFALNEISQEKHIFSQIKSRLKTIWEKEKNENNYPISVINDILKEENISKKNITEQDIIIAKDKIIQVFNPLQSDIDSIDKIFYDEFKTIANILKNIKNINTNNNYNYNNDKIMKTQIYNDVVAKFVPTTSIFNLYVSINVEQKFLAKFKEEIDKISIEEAKENITQPIIKPPSISNPSFMQPIENDLLSSISFNNNNDNFKIVGENDFGHQKSLRDSIKNSSLLKQKKLIEPNTLSENENLKMEIFNLKQTVEQLQKENKQLKEQNKSLKEELTVNETIINDLAEGNEEMQDEIVALKDKNNELQAENDSLRSFVENLE